MVLISVVAWVVGAVTSLLTADLLTRRARTALLAAAPLGSLITAAAVLGVAAGQALGVVGAAVAAAVGLGLQLAPIALA